MTSLPLSCLVLDCSRTIKSRGLCTAHYQRAQRGESLTEPPLKPYIPRTTFRGRWTCYILGCSRPSIPSVPLCKQHAATSYRFNLSPVQLQFLYQRGCGVCGQATRLHIDHDHSCCPDRGQSCGKCVRGALCSNCNTGIGLLSDNVELLKAAIKYLTTNGIE